MSGRTACQAKQAVDQVLCQVAECRSTAFSASSRNFHERRAQHGQIETELPDHSASLGDSITSHRAKSLKDSRTLQQRGVCAMLASRSGREFTLAVRPHSSSFLCRRRIDFGNPAQAVGFGIMRARDEGSADLGRVPAGYDAETKRFFCLDMTRREILHRVLSVWPFDLGSNDLDEVFSYRGRT
jgi:hypothetical protein